MSRAYMAKQRLQAACDAAALAGRRAMVNDTLISTTVTTEATKFFNFNFPQGTYRHPTFTPSVTRPSSGVVAGLGEHEQVPTAIMKMFGFTSLPISVTCDASLNFVNTDVVLVLDVTGSMVDDVNGNSTTRRRGPEDHRAQGRGDGALRRARAGPDPARRQRHAAPLRNRALFEHGQCRAPDPRGECRTYLADNAEYQTRVANYNTPTYIGTPGTPEPPVEQIYNSGTGISQARCDIYGQNQSFSGFTPTAATGGGPPPAATWARAFSNNEAAGTDWGWPGAPDTTRADRTIA